MMKSFPRACSFLAAFIGSGLLMAGCGGGSRSMVGPTPTPVGPGNAFVYTANAGGNNISGFMNDGTGALTPVSGSPFSMAGQPWGIAATPNSKFLYVSSFQNAVVNGFTINPATGSLTSLTCGTTATTGLQPLKIAITPSGGFLYTANQSGSVSGFSIDATTGCLTAVSTTPTDSVARGLTVERNGKFLYVATGGGGINAFSIAANGTLTRLLTSGFDSGTTTMLAVKASPAADLLVATDGGSANNYRVLLIDTTTGALTVRFTAGSSAVTPSAVAFGPVPAGSTVTGLFIADTGSNDFTSTSVASDGTLNFFSHQVSDPTGPVDLEMDPAGKFVYVANNGSSNVSAFMGNINGSNFNSVFISSAATGSGPESIAVVGHP
jgi:6-phosphogluconolactonase